MKELKVVNDELRKMAISCGLCGQWQDEWKYDWDVNRLFSQFYRGIDFFLDKRFVTDEYIKDNFDKETLRQNGMLVDDEFSMMNPNNAILIGRSKGTVRMNGFKVTTVYVTDESRLKIICKNRSFAMVHAYGNTSIDAKAYDSASIVVIRHSDSVSVTASEDVKIKDEIFL